MSQKSHFECQFHHKIDLGLFLNLYQCNIYNLCKLEEPEEGGEGGAELVKKLKRKFQTKILPRKFFERIFLTITYNFRVIRRTAYLQSQRLTNAYRQRLIH